MKPKQLTLVIVLALTLGGLGWWIVRRDAASFQTGGPGLGEKVLADFPLNDVTKVVIRDATNELQLVRDQEIWKVRERHDYPANFVDLGGFLRKVWELKVVQSEQVGESQLGRLQLLDPAQGGTNAGTRVEFQGAGGKSIATLLLGKKHMRQSDTSSSFGGEGYPDGRWVRVVGGAGQAALVSETFNEIEPKADRWLNKDFFKVEKLKSVEVTHPEPTNSWRLYRETEGGELKLADTTEGEKLDTGKASPVGTILSWPSFVDVVAADAPADVTGLDAPVVARLETFEGFTYQLKLGGKSETNENHHIQISVNGDFPKERTAGPDEKPEDKERLDQEFKEKTDKLEEKLKKEKAFDGWTYLVSKWTVENLLKPRKEFLAEEKPATPEATSGVVQPAEPHPGPLPPPPPVPDPIAPNP